VTERPGLIGDLRTPALSGRNSDQNLDGNVGAPAQAIVIGQEAIAAAFDGRREVQRICQFEVVTRSQNRGAVIHCGRQRRPLHVGPGKERIKSGELDLIVQQQLAAPGIPTESDQKGQGGHPSLLDDGKSPFAGTSAHK
jgi:hypothetical protein